MNVIVFFTKVQTEIIRVYILLSCIRIHVPEQLKHFLSQKSNDYYYSFNFFFLFLIEIKPPANALNQNVGLIWRMFAVNIVNFLFFFCFKFLSTHYHTLKQKKNN